MISPTGGETNLRFSLSFLRSLISGRKGWASRVICSRFCSANKTVFTDEFSMIFNIEEKIN